MSSKVFVSMLKCAMDMLTADIFNNISAYDLTSMTIEV